MKHGLLIFREFISFFLSVPQPIDPNTKATSTDLIRPWLPHWPILYAKFYIVYFVNSVCRNSTQNSRWFMCHTSKSDKQFLVYSTNEVRYYANSRLSMWITQESLVRFWCVTQLEFICQGDSVTTHLQYRFSMLTLILPGKKTHTSTSTGVQWTTKS